MEEKYKILVAVIAYNEEENIKKTLEDLINNNFGYDIVVIDNGSKDKTREIANEMGIHVVKHCINTGHSGSTITTYFNYATIYNYDILVQFDGDGQHLASEIYKLIDPIITKGVDYVIGSRFLKKEGFQSTAARRTGIKLFSWLDSIILNQKLTDITSGARAYSNKVIQLFGLVYKHEIIDTNQLLLISYIHGAKIYEVPIIMKKRDFGKSEFNIRSSLGFIFKGIINIIGIILQIKRK